MTRASLVCAVLLAMPGAALAEPYLEAHPGGYDPYASEAIERQDFVNAEDRLLKRLDENRADVPALLNLAAVMTATDRGARASSLYERVLAAENELMGSLDGSPVWSHDAATAALRGRVTLGSR